MCANNYFLNARVRLENWWWRVCTPHTTGAATGVNMGPIRCRERAKIFL